MARARSAIDKLVGFLANISEKEAIEVVKRDPQFKAISTVKRNPEKIKDVVLNALVSYQLNTTGEEYWLKFGEFLAKGGELSSFVKRENPRLLAQKLARLEKAKSLDINANLKPDELWEMLKPFGKRKKTVLFALKMFLYAKHHLGQSVIWPRHMPIPVDSRLSALTKRFALPPEKAQHFWQKVSEKTGLAPLLLDSLLWTGFLTLAGVVPQGSEKRKKHLPAQLKARRSAQKARATPFQSEHQAQPTTPPTPDKL